MIMHPKRQCLFLKLLIIILNSGKTDKSFSVHRLRKMLYAAGCSLEMRERKVNYEAV